jgi:hypothetical protein
VDALRALIESLKLTAYDLLAVLLPGAILLRGLGGIFPGGPLGGVGAAGAGTLVPDALSFGALAFTAGLVLQGAGGLAVRGRPHPDVLQTAKALIKRRYDLDLPDGLVFDFCLSKIEARRGVYDKFVALRGMARALAVAAAVLGAAGVFAAGTWAVKALAFFTALFCGTSLLALHRHYAPLGERALVGLFIAGEAQLVAALAASAEATASRS